MAIITEIVHDNFFIKNSLSPKSALADSLPIPGILALKVVLKTNFYFELLPTSSSNCCTLYPRYRMAWLGPLKSCTWEESLFDEVKNSRIQWRSGKQTSWEFKWLKTIFSSDGPLLKPWHEKRTKDSLFRWSVIKRFGSFDYRPSEKQFLITTCCVFRPAFGCYAHLKAGRNTFSAVFHLFLIFGRQIKFVYWRLSVDAWPSFHN